MYLKPSKKNYENRPELLLPQRRKALRLMIARWMEKHKTVPTVFRLGKMYEFCKEKMMKELRLWK